MNNPEIWFAWYPVKIYKGRFVWLKRVKREYGIWDENCSMDSSGYYLPSLEPEYRYYKISEDELRLIKLMEEDE